jgi:large subunit ribosomal protein L4
MAQVVDSKGNKVKEVGLDESIFGVEPNTGLLHSALVRQLANARRGTASTKTRSEVSGGGKKPWRQKGTGRARAGSIRSPLWEGGGVAFGPKPRDFSIAMPKKQRILALKQALAARKDNLVIVSDFDDVKEGKTKEFAKLLKGLKLDEQKVLLIVEGRGDQSEKIERSARNICGLTVVHVNNLNVKDLLHCQTVLTAEPVLDVISKRFQLKEEDTTAGAKKKKAPKAKAEGAQKKAVKEPKKAAAGKSEKAKAPKKETTKEPKAPKAKKAQE